jgi:hypothetical protein
MTNAARHGILAPMTPYRGVFPLALMSVLVAIRLLSFTLSQELPNDCRQSVMVQGLETREYLIHA